MTDHLKLEELHTRIRELEDRNDCLETALQDIQILLNSTEESAILATVFDGTILLCNRKAADRLGKPTKELIGLNMYEYLPPDLAESRKEQGDIVARTGKPLHFRDEREGRIYDIGLVPVFEGRQKVEKVAVYAKDITDRLELEKDLRGSEETFRTLTEQSPNMIFINTNGRIVYVNRRCQRIMGYSPAEFCASDFDFRNLITPDSLPRIEANFGEHLRGNDVEPYECGLLTKNGHRLDVVLSTKLIDFRGKKSILGIVSDITDRKRMEQALKRAHDSLETTVKERTASLTEVNQSLLREIEVHKQTQRERDEYLNKVRALVGRLSIAKEEERRRIATEVHDRIGQNLALVKIKMSELKKNLSSSDSSDEMDHILRYLDSAIHDTRSFVSEIGSPVLYELGLVPALEWLANKYGDRCHITLETKDQSSLQAIGKKLRVLLFRTAQELLSNVARHAGATACTVSLFCEGINVVLDVADNGRGFDVNEIGRDVEKRGYGLFSIRERIEPFGGSLKIDSTPGRGTCITLVVARTSLDTSGPDLI